MCVIGILNGYATLAEFKLEKSISSVDTDDDAVIEDIIEGASRLIDRDTGRTFYARTETRDYSVPTSRTLRLDDDLLTITTLTNGDGSEIANTEYHLLPKNIAPYFAIQLKSTSSVLWQSDSSGGLEYVISVAGTWGWVADHPDDIKRACLAIAVNEYNKKEGQGVESATTITGAGVIVAPRDIPASAARIIRKYVKRT